MRSIGRIASAYADIYESVKDDRDREPRNDLPLLQNLLRAHRSWRLVNIMPSYDREPERAWDEYDWERFLQQQDQKTEKYMELLEIYLDDPQRDEIIAREMGWTQLLDGKDWSAEVDALLDEDWRASDEEFAPAEEQRPTESFEDHSLYRAAFALTVWIDKLFDQHASL